MGGLLWKTKELEFNSINNKINFNVRCVPFWYEGIGLMFKTKNNAKPLFFSYSFSSRMGIFSYFIPFDFLAIWVDKNNFVVQTEIVKPKTSSVIPEKKFTKLIEIPVLKEYSEIINFFKKNKKSKIKLSLSSIR